MRRFDEQTRHRQQAKGQQWLHAALEALHAGTYRVHPLDRVVDAHRQHQRHQPEAVTHFPGFIQWAQVDRHHGTDFFVGCALTSFGQVAANGTGHGTQQHVIHRATQCFAHSLDFIQRDRRAPGNRFLGRWPTFQARARVIVHEGQRRQIGHQLATHPRCGKCGVQGGFESLHGVAHSLHGTGDPVASGIQGFDGQLRQGAHQTVGQPGMRAVASVCYFFPASAGGFAPIDHAHHDGDEGNAVGNAMVNPRDERRTTVITLNQMKLPQRAAPIQRLNGQLGHTSLQGLLIGHGCHRACTLPFARGNLLVGQGFPDHMAAHVKSLVVHPRGTGCIFNCDLTEPGNGHQPLGDALANSLVVHTGLEHPHTQNHHQVGR